MPKPGLKCLRFASRLWLAVLWAGIVACAGLPVNVSLPGKQPGGQPTAGAAGLAPTFTKPEPGAFTPTFTAINRQAQATGTPAYSCVPQKGEITAGIVSRVIDGDTIEVRDAQKNEYHKIKYIGIRAPGNDPNKPEFFGNQAASKNRELVAGKTVILIKDVTDKDASGYLLRYVFSGDTFVNYELVRLGFAFAWPTPPDVACWEIFLSAENKVKEERMGVWVMTPTPVKGKITPGANKPTRTPAPTATEKGPCDCRGPKLACTNFSNHAEAQGCYDYCKGKGWGDVFGLDPNRDGLACPELP